MATWIGEKTGDTRRDAIPLIGRSRMSEELLEALRRRVEDRYYDQPHVVEVIAQAILHSRGLYL